MARYRYPILITVFAVLLFGGAMMWARKRDPFVRKWFRIGNAECIAILPKTTQAPFPVVVYLHGAGEHLIMNGDEIRQIAELGIAVVGIEYDQSHPLAFDSQFRTLLAFVCRQPWADGSRVGWVGFSLGAQRQLAFALSHPELQPVVLVRLSGGWITQLDEMERTESKLNLRSSVFLLHGAEDQIFPASDAVRIAALLKTNATAVDLAIVPHESHGFGKDRLMIIRIAGEYCLEKLNGQRAFASYNSLLAWRAHGWGFWVYCAPAFIFVIMMFLYSVYRNQRSEQIVSCNERDAKGITTRLGFGNKKLRWIAAVLLGISSVQIAIHSWIPTLTIKSERLKLARKLLVEKQSLEDFEFLERLTIWEGNRVAVLLEHVNLAGYNRALVNWTLDDETYRNFVLSPEINRLFDGNCDWRRELWESFYPRIRKEKSIEEACRITVRFLREHVTITSQGSQNSIRGMWLRQIADEQGFEALYVAALRSVGIAARLSHEGRAEYWTGLTWNFAARPAVSVNGSVRQREVSYQNH
jgi:dienelactone hydrolase